MIINGQSDIETSFKRVFDCMAYARLTKVRWRWWMSIAPFSCKSLHERSPMTWQDSTKKLSQHKTSKKKKSLFLHLMCVHSWKNLSKPHGWRQHACEPSVPTATFFETGWTTSDSQLWLWRTLSFHSYIVAMSKDKDAAVDELSVGMLASLLHVQGCRNYTAVDSSRASRDLRDIRDSKVSSEARQQIRDDLQSFWSELRQLRRRPRHSGSPENHRKGRRRAGRRRRQRSPGKEGAAHGRAASSGSESAGSGRHGRQRYSSSGSDASRRSRSRKKNPSDSYCNSCRWWFQILFFHHLGKWSNIWLIFFNWVWFNHQLIIELLSPVFRWLPAAWQKELIERPTRGRECLVFSSQIHEWLESDKVTTVLDL